MARAPRTDTDKQTQKRSNEHLCNREELTPVYQSQNFKPPKTLTAEERVVWKWLTKVFRETVNCRVSDADVHLMELYCRAKVETDRADEELKNDPRPYIIVTLGKDKDGEDRTTAKPNPNIKRRHDNALICIKLFDQLGLSPLARARAGLQAANAKDDEEIFRKLIERSGE